MDSLINQPLKTLEDINNGKTKQKALSNKNRARDIRTTQGLSNQERHKCKP